MTEPEQDWHHRCDIPACNCGRCHQCGEDMPDPMDSPRQSVAPWGPDGCPLPGTPESVRQELYADLVRSGLSDYEAAATVWPRPMTVHAGPVTNCLPYGPVGRESHRCPRCLRYHDANGQPLRGPCDNPDCLLISEPGGARHAGPCYTKSPQ